jgi:hypothetical protein
MRPCPWASSWTQKKVNGSETTVEIHSMSYVQTHTHMAQELSCMAKLKTNRLWNGSYVGANLTLTQTIKSKPLDFWVKWGATVMALIHVWLISHDVEPWYKYTGVTQAALWLWLGVLWQQPSIMLLNVIMILIYIKGIVGV